MPPSFISPTDFPCPFHGHLRNTQQIHELLHSIPRTIPESFQQGTLRLCRWALHSENDKTLLIYSVSYFNLGGLGALFGEAKPTKDPTAMGLSIPPLWPGTYRGYGRTTGHVLNEISNMLVMISQRR